MTKREAKRDMCGITATLIEASLEAGQPYDDWAKNEPDADRLNEAAKELIAELYRRAGR